MSSSTRRGRYTPSPRLLESRELCAAVRYPCSDDARFVCGTTLVLDGGFTAM
jgi:NAD(P)-dependent dehydrogenase (short-subunit alcohol dehydrogenase family)